MTDGIDWMVICARPPLHKLYLSLLFENIFSYDTLIVMQHIGQAPHRVLKLRVSGVEPLWREKEHSLHDFFFKTHHPDLEKIFQS